LYCPHSHLPCLPLPPQLPRAGSNRLFLFYCESRKSLSPGGDIKLITSSDLGETWSSPATIYAHEAEGEVPKVCGSKLLVAKDGTWYLPGGRQLAAPAANDGGWAYSGWEVVAAGELC
jgi:hypothetical protein